MKRSVSLVAAVLVVILGGAAWAADTATVNISAQVNGTCRFNTTPVNLSFGTLDQSALGDPTVSAPLSFWCTQNSAYTLSDPVDSNGTHSDTLVDGANSIPYTLTYNNFSGNGQGRTTAIVSTLTATILNADYVNVPAGTYLDTVQFTISP